MQSTAKTTITVTAAKQFVG